MTSPMERTIKVLKESDIPYWIVERFIPGKPFGKRVDLFRIIDLISLDSGIVGVQVCGSDYKQHVTKIKYEEKENTMAWLKNGGSLEIWSWRKYLKKRGGKAKEWKVCIADILLIKGDIFIEERWKK